MMEGLRNSIIIGLGVVAISVPVGLAAAIIMNQIYHRARGLFYLVTVSPVLTPGVIIGISTVIFWKDAMGVTDFTKAYFYKGIILSIFGQSSFVAAYCLLIIMARLQRFDRAQEEAALDLGAIISAGVLAHPAALPEARPDFGRRHRLPVVASKTTTPPPSPSSPTRRWSRCWPAKCARAPRRRFRRWPSSSSASHWPAPSSTKC